MVQKRLTDEEKIVCEKYFGNICKNVLEELATDTSYDFYDFFVNQEESELTRIYEEYLALGESEKEAFKSVLRDKAGQYWDTVIISALSGVIMDSGPTGIEIAKNIKNGINKKADSLLAGQSKDISHRNKLSASKNNISQNDNIVNNNSMHNNKKYSIDFTTENKPVVKIDENILNGVPETEWVSRVKEIMKNKFSTGIPIRGKLIKVNAVSRGEYTNSKSAKALEKDNPTAYTDKLKTAGQLDEVVLASTNYINEDLNHERKDSIKEFARGEVLLEVDKNKYSAQVIIGYTHNNEMLLYDIVDMKETEFSTKKQQINVPDGSTFTYENNSAEMAGAAQNDTSLNNNRSMRNWVYDSIEAEKGEITPTGQKVFDEFYNLGKGASAETFENTFKEAFKIINQNPELKNALEYMDARQAYNAGFQDAKVKKEGGLVLNGNHKKLNKTQRADLDELGKTFGVPISVMESVNDKGIVLDGIYAGGEILVAYDGENGEKGVMIASGHEVTHRMKEFAIKSYEAYEKAVLRFIVSEKEGVGSVNELIEIYGKLLREKGVDYSKTEIMEEITADFTGELLGDSALLNDFLERVNQKDGKIREAIEYIKDFIKSIIGKISNKETQSDFERTYELLVKFAKEAKQNIENGETAKKSGKAKYSVRMDFNKQVDMALDKAMQRSHSVYIGKTPNLLQKAGLFDLPMLMSQSHMRDIHHKKDRINKHWHGLSREIIKQIPKELKAPVMIFDSISEDNKENSICVVTSLKDNDGLPIIIYVRADEGGANVYIDEKNNRNIGNEVNFVTSAYGREGFKYHIEEILKKDALIYARKNKTLKLFDELGLELPKRFNNLGFDKIIHQSRNLVNTNSMQKGKKYSVKGENIDSDKALGKVKYSVRMDFNKQVDMALDKAMQRSHSVYIGKTPNLLQKAGLFDLPMLMSQSHMRDIHHKKDEINKHWHGLSREIIKQIPKELKDPVMIFDSISEDNKGNSICVVTSLKDGDGLPIIISIRANSEQAEIYIDNNFKENKIKKSNFVTSAYGREGFKYHIEEVFKKDALIYARKNKTLKLFSDIGLELPERLNNLGFDKIIHQSRNLVNTNSMQKGKKYSVKGVGLDSAREIGRLKKENEKLRWQLKETAFTVPEGNSLKKFAPGEYNSLRKIRIGKILQKTLIDFVNNIENGKICNLLLPNNGKYGII